MASQVEHVSGIDKQVSARFSQFGTRRCPLENVLAKPLFENLDVAAQCGLCDVKFLGCLAETALFCHGNKRFIVTKIGALFHCAPTWVLLDLAGRNVCGQLML